MCIRDSLMLSQPGILLVRGEVIVPDVTPTPWRRAVFKWRPMCGDDTKASLGGCGSPHDIVDLRRVCGHLAWFVLPTGLYI